MLFSDETIARRINSEFEPVWQSVAPVAMVRVEFGSRTQTRTFGGNTATWLCDAQGRVLDMAPRVYLPESYTERLDGFLDLAARLSGLPDVELEEQLRQHHQTCLDEKRQLVIDEPEPESVRRMGNFDAILIDTRNNESKLRPRIHRKLAESGLATPAELTKWAYRDLMHLDLDDPYLGLGDSMFADYPFAAEDAETPDATRPPGQPQSSK